MIQLLEALLWLLPRVLENLENLDDLKRDRVQQSLLLRIVYISLTKCQMYGVLKCIAPNF